MGKLTINKKEIQGVFEIETDVFRDHRGVFARWFCADELKDILKGESIVNVNYSKTVKKGSIRGMHFQYPPDTETKIVRCIRGRILDVVVDVRKGSPTFLQHVAVELSEEKMNMIYIPKGFAHGFQSLEDDSEIMYLVTQFYAPQSESGLNANDPRLGIEWPLEVTDMSDKDRNRPFIDDGFEGVDLERTTMGP